jgi:hypothetical protein
VANHGGKADDSRMPILNPPEIYASYTAQYVLITFLVAAGNLRKIDKFAREHLAPATPKQEQEPRQRKLLTRLRRKTRKDRVAQWDDYKPPIPAKAD